MCGLTEDYDDFFNEVMNGGQYLRATFDCYGNYDHQREYKPRHKANERSVAHQRMWLNSGEFNQTPDSTFDSRLVVAVGEKSRNRRGQYLIMSFRNHARDPHQSGREIQGH